jgi:small-conductance mechanosensitive channel
MFATLLFTVAIQAAVPAPARDSAVVRLGNRPVAVLRDSVLGLSPAQRADGARRRLEIAAAAGSDSVATQDIPAGTVILVGGRGMFVLTPGDVDTLGGATVEQEVATTTRRLGLALTEAREAGSVRALLRGAVQVAAATVVLFVALTVLWRMRRRLTERGRRLVARWAPRLRIADIELFSPAAAETAVRWAGSLAAWAVTLVLVDVYVTYALGRFAYTRPYAEVLGQFIVDTLAMLAQGAVRAVPQLLIVALIFLVTRFLARQIGRLFTAAESGALRLPGVHPETAAPTRRIAMALIWLFALAVAFPYLPGSDSAAFRGVSVFAGLLVTLGSAGIVGQAMSGLVLMYSRSFRPGDYVRIGDVDGTVLELNLLSTRLRTPKHEIVTVPNNVVVGGRIVDYSAIGRQGEPLLIYSSVTIGYDTPWRKVHELLIRGALHTDGVLPTPEPFVLQLGLRDWYVEYQVNAAVDPARAPELPALYGALHRNIQDAFWEAGVEIMSPSYFALRDGNTVTIPPDQRPPGRTAAFRVDTNPT